MFLNIKIIRNKSKIMIWIHYFMILNIAFVGNTIWMYKQYAPSHVMKNTITKWFCSQRYPLLFTKLLKDKKVSTTECRNRFETWDSTFITMRSKTINLCFSGMIIKFQLTTEYSILHKLSSFHSLRFNLMYDINIGIFYDLSNNEEKTCEYGSNNRNLIENIYVKV